MNDLIDMMVSNESPSDISDKIKEILMQKSAENIDTLRPVVASSIFGIPDESSESEEVPEDGIDQDQEEYSEEE
jgi:hypothetical protein